MPTDVAKKHWKNLMAMRQQGASDDELEEYLQSVGAERVNTRTGVTGAAENLARGLALGTVQAGTSLAGVGGFLTRPVGGRRLEEWAKEKSREAERTYDPLGAAGVAGQLTGRLAGEALQAVTMAGPAAKAVSAIPRVGRAARAGLEGTRLQRALSTAALSSPVDVIQGLKEEEGIVLPGRAGSVAENVLLTGAVGGILPAARPRVQQPIGVRRPQEPEPIIVDQRLVRQEPQRPAGGAAPGPEGPAGPPEYVVNTAGPARLRQPARQIGAGAPPAAPEVPVTPAAAEVVAPSAAPGANPNYPLSYYSDWLFGKPGKRGIITEPPRPTIAQGNRVVGVGGNPKDDYFWLVVKGEGRRKNTIDVRPVMTGDGLKLEQVDVTYTGSADPVSGVLRGKATVRGTGRFIDTPEELVPTEGQLSKWERAEARRDARAAQEAGDEVDEVDQIDEVAQAEQAARAAGADRPGIMDEPLERMAERMPRIAPSAARLKKMGDDQVAEMWAYYTRLRQRYMDEAGIFGVDDTATLDLMESGGRPMGRKRATKWFGTKEEGRKVGRLSEEALGWLEERNISLDDYRKMVAAERRMSALDGTVARLNAETERRGLDVFGLDDTSFDFGLNREGFAAPQLISTLGGGVVGGTLGAATGDTPEERRRRGLMGLAAGAGLGFGAGRLLTRPGAAGGASGSTESIRNYNTSIRVGQRPEAAQWLGLWERIKTGVFSETYPLIKAAREMAGAAGGDRMLERIARSQGMGMAARQYIADRVEPVLQQAAGKWGDVRALLKARRDLNIRQTGGGIEILDPNGRVIYTGPRSAAATSLPSGYTVRPLRGGEKTAFTDDEVAQTIRDAEANPAVKAAADAINQVYRDLLKMKLDAGILSQADYDRILASEDFYDPFVREFATEASASGPTGKKFAIGAKGVRQMDRTADAIADTADPLEVLLSSITRTHNAVGRQRVANLFFDLAEGTESPLIRRVDGDVTPGSRRIRQLRDGQPVTYEVLNQDLYDAISGASAGSQEAGWIVKLAQAVKRVKQIGITQNPLFAAFNIARDMVASGIQRPDAIRMAREMVAGSAAGGAVGALTADEGEGLQGMLRGAVFGGAAGIYARPFLETMAAAKQIVGKDEVFKDFLRQGGSTEGFFVRSPSDARKVLTELERGGVSARDIVNPMRWPEVMQAIGSVSELAPRLAAYKQMLEAGNTKAAAALAAQDRTLRFANVGKETKGIASMTAFWNAKMQGWDKLARMLKDPRTSAVAAAAITAPTMALWSVNKDNPEYWERPLWERNLFWLVPKAGGGFWRYPKPFEIGYIFASLPERLLDYSAQAGVKIPVVGAVSSASPEIAEPGEQLTRSMGEMAGSTMGGTLPLPDVISVPFQLAADYDIFRGRRIVGDRNIPAPQQVTPESSGLARVLAEQAGVSPQRTDFVVRSTLGTLGQAGSGGLDWAIRQAGGEAPEPAPRRGLADLIPQRFTTKTYSSTELETQARDRLAALERVHRGLTVEQASNDPDAIRAYVKANRKDLDAYDNLSTMRRALDRTAAERRAIIRNVALKPERRQELLDALRKTGDTQARQVLKYRSR